MRFTAAFWCRIGLVASLTLIWPIVEKFYWPIGGGLDVAGHPIGRDFINVWSAPQFAFSGHIGSLFDKEAYTQAISRLFGAELPFHVWSYPPNALILFWPFGQLPYFVALALWLLLTLAAYLAAALVPVPLSRRGIAVALLLFAPAGLLNALGGQNGYLTAALFLGGFLCLETRPVLAGLLFGLLSVKPHLGLLVPFALIVLRAWRAILFAALTAMVMAAISVLIFGVEPWIRYFTETGAWTVQFISDFQGFYTIMMTSVFAELRIFGVPAGTAWGVQIAISLLVLPIALLAIARTGDRLLQTEILVVATTLTTPYLFNYDLTALSAVAVWRLTNMQARPLSKPRRYFYGLVWIAPICTVWLNIFGLGLGPLVPILLFCASVREAYGGGQQGSKASAES